MTTTVRTEIHIDPIQMPEDGKVWICQECEEVATEEPEFDKLYECTECSDKFKGSNGGGKNGNMCPNCGNKFGTRIDEGDKNGSPICPSCEQGVTEETELATCPFCDWHGNNVGEVDVDEYMEHFFEDHIGELAYSVVNVETAAVAEVSSE